MIAKSWGFLLFEASTVGADVELTQAADFLWPTSAARNPMRNHGSKGFALGQWQSAAWVKKSSAATWTEPTILFRRPLRYRSVSPRTWEMVQNRPCLFE